MSGGNAVAEGAAGAVPPRVLHIASRRVVRPLLGDGASFDARLAWVHAELTDQLAEALQAEPRETPPLHFVCSTILSKMVSGCSDQTQALQHAIEQRTGLRSSGLLQAYQCTGWGFALRFVAQHTTHQRLLLSIVDADLHDTMSTGYEAAIGGIGFGVTTLELDLAGNAEAPKCDGPFANHAFTDLLHAVRAQHKRHGRLPTFMPFLPDGLDGVARRMLGGVMAPNRHDHFGHTFGSDSWIGLAEWLQREPPQQEHDVLLGGFAYDGYYIAGRGRVGPFTRVSLRPDLLPDPRPEPLATEGAL